MKYEVTTLRLGDYLLRHHFHRERFRAVSLKDGPSSVTQRVSPTTIVRDRAAYDRCWVVCCFESITIFADRCTHLSGRSPL
jgi:hypothetical protein